jgi:hypothetical protein
MLDVTCSEESAITRTDGQSLGPWAGPACAHTASSAAAEPGMCNREEDKAILAEGRGNGKPPSQRKSSGAEQIPSHRVAVQERGAHEGFAGAAQGTASNEEGRDIWRRRALIEGSGHVRRSSHPNSRAWPLLFMLAFANAWVLLVEIKRCRTG